jgi:hypothetical protein
MTRDGRAANAAALTSDNADHGPAIVLRKTTALKTIVAHDHRAIKRVIRPMVGARRAPPRRPPAPA